MRKGDWSAENPYWKSLFSMKAGFSAADRQGDRRNSFAHEIPVLHVKPRKIFPQTYVLRILLKNFASGNILFIALPDTAQTENIIDADILAKLKGKYIVNVGRGNCIDERALYSPALKREVLRARLSIPGVPSRKTAKNPISRSRRSLTNLTT